MMDFLTSPLINPLLSTVTGRRNDSPYMGAMKKLYAVVQSPKTRLWEVVEVDDALRSPAGASKVHENYWHAWAEACRRNSPITDKM